MSKPMEVSLEQRICTEIEDLHSFFEGWLGGTLVREREVFARLERALAVGFELVTPDGVEQVRGELLDQLWQAHGARPGVRIWTEGCRLLDASVAGLALCRYEELQRVGDAGPVTRRLSTGLFAVQPDAIGWLHVHETWRVG